MLERASKQPNGAGHGRPDFIVESREFPNLVVIYECKADVRKHESPGGNKPRDYAVDGVLWYAERCAKKLDVIAVAVSGQTATELHVSTYFWPKGASQPIFLSGPHGPIEKLIPFVDAATLRSYDPTDKHEAEKKLLAFARTLHDSLREHAKLSEPEKPLVVSAGLLGLKDAAFAASFDTMLAKDLPKRLIEAMKTQLREAGIPDEKRRLMMQPYSFMVEHQALNDMGEGTVSPLKGILSQLNENARPFLDDHADIDVLGQFYAEFLRYATGDGKDLGIVLTPRHVCELMVKLAGISVNDTVLDTCTGSGGCLIAEMNAMDAQAGGDEEKRASIRSQQLIGVEARPDMYALAVTNMMFRGDGKANLYQGSCFDKDISRFIKKTRLNDDDSLRHKRPNKGLINPPYSQEEKGLDEITFIDHMLDLLEPGGIGVAIVPMSCALGTKPKYKEPRRQMLEKHTLLGVMSMPDELFVPAASTITCIMVLQAHQSHKHFEGETWFGYWKEDGFVRNRTLGRAPRKQEDWLAVRSDWLNHYRLRATIEGLCVAKKVDADQEWCAEAYMETNTAKTKPPFYDKALRDFALYRLSLDPPEVDSVGA